MERPRGFIKRRALGNFNENFTGKMGLYVAKANKVSQFRGSLNCALCFAIQAITRDGDSLWCVRHIERP